VDFDERVPMKLRTIKTKKLPKAVRRITILRTPEKLTLGGGLGRIEVKRKRKRKKQSKGLTRLFERVARRSAKADSKTAKAYLDRHRRSNRKKRDGWLRDLSYNIMRSRRKGGKSFKLSKLFG
jgi:hypothetical protein